MHSDWSGGTHDDDSMIEPFMKTLMEETGMELDDDFTDNTTEMDLDRDVPKMTAILGEA